MYHDTLAVVLAGGKGERLEPLTRDRAKPAVPFGGLYRIIDFPLSNCVNSELRRILVLTQYKAMSLDRHIDLGWRRFFHRERGELIDVLPPQQRIDANWYQGTADAVYQNIYAIERERPKYVLILAGDHIYKMNYARMVEFHVENSADVTVGALNVTPQEASQFGVMEIDQKRRIVGFEEKPAQPKTVPGASDQCLASMGIYVFEAEFLYETLLADATNRNSQHDFGKNIIPGSIENQRVFAYPFEDENRKDESYWRDVGTIDAYYDANMDLCRVEPMLNLYDEAWPIWTFQPNLPPPKFVFGSHGGWDRSGRALDSNVCAGSIVSGGLVERSVVGPRGKIHSYSHVSDSILFEGVEIGRHAVVRRAILDKWIQVPPGMRIGVDPEEDRRRGFAVSKNGIVVVSKDSDLSLYV
jgi:glucose-1-phosphate adenylyltransferase